MRILGSLILIAFMLLADVKVYLKQNPIDVGDMAELVIEATGDEIHLPKIDRIGPYPIASSAIQETITQKGEHFIHKKIQTITFFPDKNITIPSFSLTIDGKEIHTKPLELNLKAYRTTPLVQFLLQANKDEAFVGEPIIINLVLKIKDNLKLVDYDLKMPKFDHFWVKELKSEPTKHRGAFIIKKITLLATPQKSGNFTIGPAVFRYAISQKGVDLFGFSITAPAWKSALSNTLKFHIKPLVKDVDLVGDFALAAFVDKKRAKPNEPIHLKVVIAGKGNLENFDGFSLDIDGATIYTDKPKIEQNYENGHLKARFEQRFTIIADRNFTIPALEVDYFSLRFKKIKKLQTKPIIVAIENSSYSEVKRTPLSKEVKKSAVRWYFDLKSFLIGFVGGALFILLIPFLKNYKRVSRQQKRVALNSLMPYLASSLKARQMAERLYKGEKVSQKELRELLKELKGFDEAL